MTFLASVPSGPSGTRKVRISLPLVPFLLDGRRYFRPDEIAARRGPRFARSIAARLDRIGRAIPERARGPLWTAHDRARAKRRREQRDLAELAEGLGDPV